MTRIKIRKIFLNIIPILVMIGLIPLVQNDYLLTLLYIIIIIFCLVIKKERNDIALLFFGFCAMIFFEYIFINTGVETFVRNSLFGLMPIWLPFLWGYGFVAIKRGVEIIDQ